MQGLKQTSSSPSPRVFSTDCLTSSPCRRSSVVRLHHQFAFNLTCLAVASDVTASPGNRISFFHANLPLGPFVSWFCLLQTEERNPSRHCTGKRTICEFWKKLCMQPDCPFWYVQQTSVREGYLSLP